MTQKDITTVRGLVEFLKSENEILITAEEVDPIYEVAGIQKAFEDGPAVLFENVKGYPDHRILINVFAKRAHLAKIFGVSDPEKFKFKALDAIRNPVPPRIADNAPCQEVVLTKDIDVLKTMPVTQLVETDPGRIISGGIALFSGSDIGHCIAYRRTFFRGKDWASMSIAAAGHMEYFLLERKKENGKVPLTLNIGCPPAVMVVGAAGMMQLTVPAGSDELAIASGLQGTPIEICQAKTVDAYAIANAEWVIEGYLDTSQTVWESEEAEKTGDVWRPFLIEWRGYLGRARRTYKFQATAITHRQDNPIYYSSLASCFEVFTRTGSFAEAMFYDVGNRIRPGLVQDVNALDSMHGQAGIVIQIRKRGPEDDEFAKNLILAAFAASTNIQLAVVVDEDVNIYSADDILWALMTRVDHKQDVIAFSESGGTRPGRVGRQGRAGYDATVPFESKFVYFRGKHPKVNLEKWFTREEIEKVWAEQSEYARFLAQNRL